MNRLQELMKRDHISNPHQLATKADFNYKSVQRWYSKGKVPGEQNLKRLADFFGVNPSWLRYGEKEDAPTLTDELTHLINIAKQGIEASPEKLEMFKKVVGAIFGEEKENREPGSFQPKKTKTPIKKKQRPA